MTGDQKSSVSYIKKFVIIVLNKHVSDNIHDFIFSKNTEVLKSTNSWSSFKQLGSVIY